jgi:hypothetical protein
MTRSPTPPSWQLRGQSWPVAVGLALATLTIVVSERLPPTFAADLHAMILVFIAAPYAGFASIDGRTREMTREFVGIAVFCLLAVLGLWVWQPLWIVGYAGHALWDALHRPGSHFGAEVVGWYVPFCVVYDLVVAGYLATVLLVT